MCVYCIYILCAWQMNMSMLPLRIVSHLALELCRVPRVCAQRPSNGNDCNGSVKCRANVKFYDKE